MGIKFSSRLLASVRPWVQTPAPPEKGKKKKLYPSLAHMLSLASGFFTSSSLGLNQN